MNFGLARRVLAGKPETTWATIEAALRPLAQNRNAAREIASAFYNVYWVPIDSPYTTWEEAADGVDAALEATGTPGGCFNLSWRGAGGMVAELRGRDEQYMDWCYDAVSGEVSDRVRRVMESLGLRPVT